jgi:hypothetical protein
LSRPEFGAARISQAMAPRNGGVTNDAVTSARIAPVIGMSVRATSQPIGAATMQQARLELTATIAVVSIGSRNSGSAKKAWKFSSVKAPARSTKL